MITLDNGTPQGVKGATMLAALAEARIFNVLVEDDQFIVEEACDYAFSVKLTREQLMALANELLLMAMVTPTATNLPEHHNAH